MGIFRPVHLITTSDVRIEPFGVHIWNDTTVSERSAVLHLETTVKNYTGKPVTISITQQLLDKDGRAVVKATSSNTVQPGNTIVTPQQLPEIKSPHLWSVNDPWCYKLVTTISENGKTIDAVTTPYGIRWISWPIGRAGGNKQFLINGKPVFINGIAEYEHLIGGSHAFDEAEITARVQEIKAVGCTPAA
jgi:beta-galactosidase/beta-glucuronidase